LEFFATICARAWINSVSGNLLARLVACLATTQVDTRAEGISNVEQYLVE
jgi:hypothetical protein